MRENTDLFESLKTILFASHFILKGKKYSLVELFLYAPAAYEKLVELHKVPSDAITFFKQKGTSLVYISNAIDIEGIRKIKYEDILREYCGLARNVLFDQSSNESLIVKQIIEKQRRQPVKWTYRDLSDQTRRYSTASGEKCHLDITQSKLGNGNYYRLTYRETEYSGSDCKQLLEYVLSTNPQYKEQPHSSVIHTKKEVNQAIQEKKKQKKQKRQEQMRRQQEYADKQRIIEHERKEREASQKQLIAEQERIQKEQREYERRKELASYPQINIKDFVIKKTSFMCRYNDHYAEDITAVIHLILKDGTIMSKKISAGYCYDCDRYFIMNSTFEDIKKWGIPLCRIKDETKVPTNKRNSIFAEEFAAESPLMQFGYNVSQKEGLTSQARQKLLAILVDNAIMRRSDIISYLDSFIKLRQDQPHQSIAISKWEEDRYFISRYQLNSITMYEIGTLYRY